MDDCVSGPTFFCSHSNITRFTLNMELPEQEGLGKFMEDHQYNPQSVCLCHRLWAFDVMAERIGASRDALDLKYAAAEYLDTVTKIDAVYRKDSTNMQQQQKAEAEAWAAAETGTETRASSSSIRLSSKGGKGKGGKADAEERPSKAMRTADLLQ